MKMLFARVAEAAEFRLSVFAVTSTYKLVIVFNRC